MHSVYRMFERPLLTSSLSPTLPALIPTPRIPQSTVKGDGVSDTVLCVCHDLFGVPQEDPAVVKCTYSVQHSQAVLAWCLWSSCVGRGTVRRPLTAPAHAKRRYQGPSRQVKLLCTFEISSSSVHAAVHTCSPRTLGPSGVVWEWTYWTLPCLGYLVCPHNITLRSTARRGRTLSNGNECELQGILLSRTAAGLEFLPSVALTLDH